VTLLAVYDKPGDGDLPDWQLVKMNWPQQDWQQKQLSWKKVQAKAENLS
jgi:hypothetical protein